MLRIVQVSDSHLSPTAAYAGANWRAVLDHVRDTRPDMVIHTGDISLNGADEVADLVYARARLDRLGVEWLAIPGNHDIGDFGDVDQPVDAARRQRYAAVFGDASWSVSLGGWRLVGVDVQTLSSDLDAAGELWGWLAGELLHDAPTALFIHRPIRPWGPDEFDDPGRYVTEPTRSRLVTLAERGDVRLVASGHVHQWRHITESTAHVWAPSTWAVLPARIQPSIGTKVVGLVEHDLGSDGQVTSTLVQPSGIRQVTIGDDFESPYSH